MSLFNNKCRESIVQLVKRVLHPRQKLLRGYVCQLGQELETKVKSTNSSPAGQKVKE